MAGRTYSILSWNVNGLRAAIKKGFFDWFRRESPDILCLQEVKARPEQLPEEVLRPQGYHAHWNAAERPGYSGVGTISRQKPVSVRLGLGEERFDREGRVLETDFGEFTLLNIYFPNGQMNAERLRFKLDFYDEALRYFTRLKKQKKRLVICGDYNTAHRPIDLAHPKENERTSGFLPVEREWLDRLVAAGFVDTFRVFDPRPEQYTWWDLRTFARQRNVGWRIDYHFVSEDLRDHLESAKIHPDVAGSDHCPVSVRLRF